MKHNQIFLVVFWKNSIWWISQQYSNVSSAWYKYEPHWVDLWRSEKIRYSSLRVILVWNTNIFPFKSLKLFRQLLNKLWCQRNDHSLFINHFFIILEIEMDWIVCILVDKRKSSKSWEPVFCQLTARYCSLMFNSECAKHELTFIQ